ncbi:hypothetical protein UK12_34750, partial [Saccharothrix sp. ST-888]
RLADHLDVGLGVQQRPEPGPHQDLVVGQQYPDPPPSPFPVWSVPPAAPAVLPPAVGTPAGIRKTPTTHGPGTSVPPKAVTRSSIRTSTMPEPLFPVLGVAGSRSTT